MSDIRTPLDRLSDVLAQAFRPLTASVVQLATAAAQLATAVSDLGHKRVDAGGLPVSVDPPAFAALTVVTLPPDEGERNEYLQAMTASVESPNAPFDMEQSIRGSNQWECDGAKHAEHGGGLRPLRCADCTTDQNLDCLSAYGLIDQAEKAIGQVSDDVEMRRLLHAPLRGAPAAGGTGEGTLPSPPGKVIPVDRVLRNVPRARAAARRESAYRFPSPPSKEGRVVPKPAAKPVAKSTATKKEPAAKPVAKSAAAKKVPAKKSLTKRK